MKDGTVGRKVNLTAALCLAGVLCSGFLCPAAPESGDLDALLRENGIAAESTGLCLDLAFGDGRLALQIAQKTKMAVFALAKDEKDCEAARQLLNEAGVFGTRATVVVGSAGRLPVPDCYGNLVVTGEYQEGLDLKEVRRVLNPNGIAVIGGDRTDAAKLKAALAAAGIGDAKMLGNRAVFRGKMSEGVDEWTHRTPRPDNLLVTRDPRIRPPFRTQWILDDPTRPVQAAAIANGRMLLRQEMHGRLMSLDVFNGMTLWERPWDQDGYRIGERLMEGSAYTQLWIANQATQPCYALVDGVFYVLERNKIVARSASSGERIREFGIPEYDASRWKYRAPGWFEGKSYENVMSVLPETHGLWWWWLAVQDGRLYAMAQTPTDKADNVRDSGDLLCAFDLTDGKLRWKNLVRKPIYGPSLALGDGNIFYITIDELDAKAKFSTLFNGTVHAVDAATGKARWGGSELGGRLGASRFAGGYSDGRYFVWKIQAGGSNKVTHASRSYDAKSGKLFREYSAYTDRAQNLVVGDRMFYSNGRLKNQRGRQGTLYGCVDVETGEEIPHKISNQIIKNGCGIGNATPTCIFQGGQGFGAYDLETGATWEHLFYRTGCDYGPLIGNGMVVHLPSYCHCEYGQWAALWLAPAGTNWTVPKVDADMPSRLVKGPAFGSGMTSGDGDEWTHFRGNSGHNGEVATPPRLPFKLLWKVQLGRNLTPPSCGGGLVFVSSHDGRVWGLDRGTGEIRWTFLSGAGVRVTPSYRKGRLLFGSHDGWVYCLEAASGRLAWKFRVAPEERYINVAGQMNSVWPSAAGVVLDKDVAYCAGGYFSYDGAYLYALDITTGGVIWAKCIGDITQQQGAPQGIMALAGDTLVMPVYAVHFDDAESRTHGYSTKDGLRLPWYPRDDFRQCRRHMWSGTEAIADGDAFFQGGVRRSAPYGRGKTWLYSMGDVETGWSYGSKFSSAYQTLFSPDAAPVLGTHSILGNGKLYDRANVSAKLKAFSSPTKGVQALSKDDYVELWSEGKAQSLALAGGVALVAWNNEVAAYEAKAVGKEMCRLAFPGTVLRNGLAVSGGAMFLVTQEGFLIGLGAR